MTSGEAQGAAREEGACEVCGATDEWKYVRAVAGSMCGRCLRENRDRIGLRPAVRADQPEEKDGERRFLVELTFPTSPTDPPVFDAKDVCDAINATLPAPDIGVQVTLIRAEPVLPPPSEERFGRVHGGEKSDGTCTCPECRGGMKVETVPDPPAQEGRVWEIWIGGSGYPLAQTPGDPLVKRKVEVCSVSERDEALAEVELVEEARAAYEKERDWLDGKLTESEAEVKRLGHQLEGVADSLIRANRENKRLRQLHDGACKRIAEMHAEGQRLREALERMRDGMIEALSDHGTYADLKERVADLADDEQARS